VNRPAPTRLEMADYHDELGAIAEHLRELERRYRKVLDARRLMALRAAVRYAGEAGENLS